jgi:ABC-2 type transport system ATP-binding protein
MTVLPVAETTLPPGALVALIVLGVAEVALVVFCLIDLVRRPAVLGDRKWLWALLIVLFAIPGSIIYLAVGRVPAPAAEQLPEAEDRPPADTAADALYARPVAAVAGAGEYSSPAGPAIEIVGLVKDFKKARALDGVDLVVPEGSVFGFLGPNGAGKTTTLRILAGLARPTAGEARVFGHDTTRDADAVHALIGFLPDVPGFYKWMTAREYLELSAGLFGLHGAARDERIATLLELAGLAGVTTKVGGYSRGMKQRLGVAQALINSPHLLLLDEPTSALDPIGRREVLEMIAALSGRTTVFFSTHILADVERVCDTVAVLAGGRIVEQAGIDELRARHGGAQRVVIEVDDPQRLEQALAAEVWAGDLRRDGRELVVDVTDLELAYRAVPALVARLGISLRRFDADEASLEDVFVDLVQGAGR